MKLIAWSNASFWELDLEREGEKRVKKGGRVERRKQVTLGAKEIKEEEMVCREEKELETKKEAGEREVMEVEMMDGNKRRRRERRWKSKKGRRSWRRWGSCSSRRWGRKRRSSSSRRCWRSSSSRWTRSSGSRRWRRSGRSSDLGSHQHVVSVVVGSEMLEALRELPHLISVSRCLATLPHYWLSVIDCSCLTLPRSHTHSLPLTGCTEPRSHQTHF